MRHRRIAPCMVLAVVAVALASVPARADDIDFTCSLNPNAACTGTVVQSGSNYSTTGISLFNDSGPYAANVPFTLVFNTSTDSISLDGTGVYLGQDLIGTITGFSVSSGKSTTDLSFSTDWPTLPLIVQTRLGSTAGVDSGFIIYVTKKMSPESADVLITPASVPEPGSLMLLGSGLLGLGGFLRRKLLAH